MPNSERIPDPSFVLGIPRSGTTWLANIVDAAPDTRVFLEPFSTIAIDFFRPIPPTNSFLEYQSAELIEYFRGEFLNSLDKNKTLFSSSGNSVFRFRIERRLSRILKTFCKYTPLERSGRFRVFDLLNLNRMTLDYPLYPKDRVARHYVIKELRASGKLGTLLKAFPSSRIVAIIRHPCATIYSILNWFQKNKLTELRNELVYFLDSLRSQKIGEEYEAAINDCRESGHLASTIALYWRVHYENVFSRLEPLDNGLVVPYESLASAPFQTAKDILNFLNIELSGSVKDYLTTSSTANGKSKSPTSTIRDSATFYREWQNKIDPEIEQKVMQITESSSLMELFHPYYK